MTGLDGVSDKIIGAVITGVIGLIFLLIQRRLEPGAKLGYWIPHDYIFDVPLDNQPHPLRIQTATLTIQNLGRKTAEEVAIMHAAKPDHFQLHPRRDYEQHTAPDGTHTITVGSLGPKEVLQVQVLGHRTTPVLAGIRSKDGPAKSVRFQIIRLYPKALNAFFITCFLAGAFVLVYWVVRAVLFVSRANGML